MPMWQHKRKSPAPLPHPARPSADTLSAALLDAIAAKDLTAARQVFDRAFWDKSDFRPDGYHLLHAVRRGDRDMVKLLTTHGAVWTPEETRTARRMTPPEPWSAVEGVLRQAGMRTQFTDAELRNIKPVLMTTWARRNVEHAERQNAPDAQKQRLALERMTITGVVLLMRAGRAGEAIELLMTRGKKFGDGSRQHPLDVAQEFRAMAITGQDGKTALAFLDALKKKGLAIKPLADWRLPPELLKELDARSLLARASAEDRMSLMRSWSILQPKVDTGIAGVIELDPAFVEKKRAELKEAAQLLFRSVPPPSPEDAELFVGMHEARAQQSPYALSQMEKELLALGFFDSPAFTVKHLKRLAETAPKGPDFDSIGLGAQFNRLASARLLSEQGAEKFLSPSKFHEIETAHRTGAWKADARDTGRILDYLATQVKRDAVPESVIVSLKILRDGGADFSKINPLRYLGKKEPGLCKTLLDLGIVAARDIELDALARRSGGELRPLTPRKAEGYADQEFMCQIVLESFAPDKFIPLRGQEDISYQREFLREYTTNPQMKRRFMAGRIHAPKP
jgi:hypothetical protein